MPRRPVLAAAFLQVAFVPIAAAAGVYFDDRGERLVLGNDALEIQLSKANGAVLALLDRAANASLTLGSRGGCLWGAVFPDAPSGATYVGGCSFAAGWGNTFTYAWSAATSTLVLSYGFDSGAPHRVDASVTLTLGAGHSFDLRLSLHNRWGHALKRVHFPSEWTYRDADVEAGYFPFQLPGVRLDPAFFRSNRSWSSTYPGLFAFADFLALQLGSGQLAMYSINPSGPIAPVILGFLDDEATAAGTFMAIHVFETAVADGGRFESPVVRVCIGDPPRSTVLGYRTDNLIDRYPSLGAKLGSRFGTLAASPLVLADWDFFAKPFRSAIPDLGLIGTPAVFHTVNTHPCAFDHCGPDYLPPDPRWGSSSDLAALADAVRARDMVFMPYTNPTWWNPDSPTLLNLPAPLTLRDIAALDAAGQPLYEEYGAPPVANPGYVMCAHVPFVAERVDRLLASWRDEVPADLVFLDQVGARPWMRDFNPASPTVLAFHDGWLALAAAHQARGLMTEDGWDRLAAVLVGFCGSPMTSATGFGGGVDRYGTGGNGNRLLGPGMWDPYPLATWLLHDKVLTYQHDLEKTVTAVNLEVLTWDLAFGNMLHYIWPGLTGPYPRPTPERIALVHALQRAVASRCAGRALDDFEYLTPSVTRSRFGELSIVASWDLGEPFDAGGSRVAPTGFLAEAADGSMVAGAFSGVFNGRALSAGIHYLVIERSPQAVTVRQPEGADGDLLVDGCTRGLASVRALDARGASLGNVAFTPEGTRVRFAYRRLLGGQAVDRYELQCLHSQPRRHLRKAATARP